MPPGRPRGSARGTTRGRGRGRGRGGASSSVPAANSDASNLPADEPTAAQVSQPTTEFPETSSQTLPDDSATQTQVEDSGPSTVAAPTVAKSSRVESIKSASRVASPAAGSSTKGKVTPKPSFTGRRSKTERDAREYEAAQRDKARRAEVAAQAPPSRGSARGRGRGGRGRGRGGHMSDVVVSGPFSSGLYSADTSKGRFLQRSTGWGSSRGEGSSGTRVKREPKVKLDPSGDGDAFMTGADHIKLEDDEESVYSDYDDSTEGPRKNIEFINLLSDDEDDANVPYTDTLAPVRVRRMEHKDRVVGINTESSAAVTAGTSGGAGKAPAASRKGKAKIKDAEGAQSERIWQGAYEDDQAAPEASAHPEMAGDTDVTMKSSPEPVQEPETAQEDEAIIKPPSSPEIPKKNRRKSSFRGPKPHLQTEEEKAEWERQQNELSKIVHELGKIAPPETAAQAEKSAQGEKDPQAEKQGEEQGETQTEEARNVRDDHVYLFQFPPMLPELSQVVIKSELPAEPTIPADLSAEEPTSTDKPIKVEDDADGAASKPAPGPNLASGIVGKMKVHRSGKVTLDWGGTSLELRLGMDTQFLQEAVLCRVDSKGTDRIGGECMAFGNVRGKFVVTPDWEEILGVSMGL